ncbi:MAG: GcrA family cell cycle regulator, partial [Pseudomonadota bacterium]|nr:GcrA family cell cycle regulator [Pseudomonadota bacterium]
PMPNKNSDLPKIVSVGPGGFLRQGPGDQQAPIPPAPPRRLVPAKPSPEIADKTSLLDLSDKVCRWPMGHPGEPDFHFCGEAVNPGFPYCVEHCGRAYQAQLPRGARRPPPPLPFGGPRVR